MGKAKWPRGSRKWRLVGKFEDLKAAEYAKSLPLADGFDTVVRGEQRARRWRWIVYRSARPTRRDVKNRFRLEVLSEVLRAWVIDTRSTEGHGLIGVYYFDSVRCGRTTYPALCRDGLTIATFRTRRAALEGLKEVSAGFPKARVARALITVDVEG